MLLRPSVPLVCSLALLLLAGCSSARLKRSPTATTRVRPKTDARCRYYLGTGLASRDQLGDARKEAWKAAAEQLVRENFGVRATIRSESKENLKEATFQATLTEDSEEAQINGLALQSETLHELEGTGIRVEATYCYPHAERLKELKRLEQVREARQEEAKQAEKRVDPPTETPEPETPPDPFLQARGGLGAHFLLLSGTSGVMWGGEISYDAAMAGRLGFRTGGGFEAQSAIPYNTLGAWIALGPSVSLVRLGEHFKVRIVAQVQIGDQRKIYTGKIYSLTEDLSYSKGANGYAIGIELIKDSGLSFQFRVLTRADEVQGVFGIGGATW